MRVEITLTAEAEALVSKLMRERNLTFNDAVNMAIINSHGRNAGDSSDTQTITSQSAASQNRKFRTPTYSMGPSRIPLDHALAIAAQLEDAALTSQADLPSNSGGEGTQLG